MLEKIASMKNGVSLSKEALRPCSNQPVIEHANTELKKKNGGYWAWFILHIGFIFLAFTLFYYQDKKSIKFVLTYSGYSAVGFLLFTLALNPLIKIFPTFNLLRQANKYRRKLGVASFSYALLHMISYFVKKGWSGLLKLLYPELILTAFIAMPILFALAITSNKYSKQKFGGERWKQLHKTVYIAEAAVVIHMILMDEIFWALILFTPVVAVQLIRKNLK